MANTRFENLRAKEVEEGAFHKHPEGLCTFLPLGRGGEVREQLSADQLEKLHWAFASTLDRFG